MESLSAQKASAVGDMSRCKHGSFAGYCEECNDICGRCHGAGEIKVMTQEFGPFDYEVDVECPNCKGIGLVDRRHPTVEAKP